MHFNAFVGICITVSHNIEYNNYNDNSELLELSLKLHSHFVHYLLLLPVSGLLFRQHGGQKNFLHQGQ